MRNFRNYEVWKLAISFCKDIYLLTDSLPDSEKYGIVSQIKRASVSVSSNIAEGCSRKSEKDFAGFIKIALGSSFEVENLLILCEELAFIGGGKLIHIKATLDILEKKLNALYTKLTEKNK